MCVVTSSSPNAARKALASRTRSALFSAVSGGCHISRGEPFGASSVFGTLCSVKAYSLGSGSEVDSHIHLRGQFANYPHIKTTLPPCQVQFKALSCPQ